MHSRQNRFFTFSGVMEGWDFGNPLCGNNTKTCCSYLKQKCVTFKLTVIIVGRKRRSNFRRVMDARQKKHVVAANPLRIWASHVTRLSPCPLCCLGCRACPPPLYLHEQEAGWHCNLQFNWFLKSIKWCHVGFKTTRSKLDAGDFLNPKYVQSIGRWRWRRDDVAKQAA